jgi:23S rRNA pseudouridine1911/1915/1917 synthase
MPHLDLFCARPDKDQTLAAVLKRRLGLSWTRVRAIIEGRHVKVGGQVESDPVRRVRTGLRISIATHVLDPDLVRSLSAREAKFSRAAKPEAKTEAKKKEAAKKPEAKKKPEPKPVAKPSPPEIDIVYADDSMVIVNKPAGLTTMRHAEEADEFGEGKRFLPKTLIDLLPALLGAPNRKLIAVHRIDRDTSGLVAFARTKPAAKHLMDQFKRHAAEREYLAIVRGCPAPVRIQSELVRDRGDGRRGSGTDNDAKRAVTHVRIAEKLGDFAVVRCKLETGRTHQVRIHMGEAGSPLCGERVYDRPIHGKPIADSSDAKRPMLHAATLGVIHPETGETMTWSVAPPADFSELWAWLRRQAAASPAVP